MEPYAWESDDPDHPRPAEVARLEAFLNTVDRHRFGEHARKPADHRDLLTSPERLRGWFVSHGLLDDIAVVTAEDLRAALPLRDGLRAWLQARQRLDHDPAALGRAREAIAQLRLHVSLGPQSAALEPASGGGGGALERLAGDLAIAHATGALQRLRICSAPDCQFVYYDHSRSGTSRWCSMRTCGNRAKTRRYRHRQRD